LGCRVGLWTLWRMLKIVGSELLWLLVNFLLLLLLLLLRTWRWWRWWRGLDQQLVQ